MIAVRATFAGFPVSMRIGLHVWIEASGDEDRHVEGLAGLRHGNCGGSVFSG
jgi:hypothetical protein